MRFNKRTFLFGAAVTVAVVAISIGIYFVKNPSLPPMSWLNSGHANAAQNQMSSAQELATKTITLEDAQLKSIKIEPAGEHLFANEREAIGSIDFNEDRSVQVFPPNQGKSSDCLPTLAMRWSKGRSCTPSRAPTLYKPSRT